MLNQKQFVDYIVHPILVNIDLWSPAAEILLIGTALVESRLTYIHQLGGPALGLYQMEPDTHDDIWDNVLSYRGYLRDKVRLFGRNAPEMMYNLAYATIMCRLQYWRQSEGLPSVDSAIDLARYHKKYYNTFAGKTDVRESVKVFQEVIDEHRPK